ncbi:MAG: ribosome-associated translation inhibitor RaiA [Clostridia bacterium]|nr:ribosome-associated translation inhibitor RaiA [Clostridia bacterium]
MKLTITAQNMVVTPAITKRIEKKTETMGRYLRPDTEMLIKLRKEKKLRIVEITVPMGKNVILRSEAAAEDNLFLAIDQALAKMERQIRKHRTKLGKNLREEIPDVPEFIEEDDDAAEEKDRKIVKRKTFPVRPMSVEDAMIEMELLGHNFFAFVNIDTEQTNVLYLRKDGDLGLLEPEV